MTFPVFRKQKSYQMTKHTFIQYGTFSMALIVPIFIFSLVMLFIPGFRDSGGAAVMGFVALTMLICILIFFKLTISIDETHLRFSLGVGLIKKKYPFEEISSCRPVKNFPLTGIGIRKIPNGWLYNVSGLGAIELAFKNRGSIVRIGTNNPELVSQTINELIKQEIHGSATYENRKTGNYSSIAIFFIVIVSVAILQLTGNKETTVITTDKGFTINGMYGVTFNYSDIISLDTLSAMPGIKLRTNGFAFGKTLKGNFMLEDKSRVKLFIIKGAPPYIHIRSDAGEFYLSFKDSNKTRDLYKQLEKGLTGTK